MAFHYGVPGDAQVRTERGLVPIILLRDEDRIWNGEEFVEHEGVVYIGTQLFMEHSGVVGTNGLFVYPDPDGLPVMLCVAAHYGIPIRYIGKGTTPCVLPDSPQHRGKAYTLLNAGPRHVFECQGVLVHNMTV